MAEVNRRDKQALELAKLHTTVAEGIETAEFACVQSWSKQRSTIWTLFEEQHRAIMKRAGVSEQDEHTSIFENNAEVNEAICATIEKRYEQLCASKNTNTRTNAAPPKETHIRQSTLMRQLRRLCEYIDANIVEITTGEVNDIRRRINDFDVELDRVRIERLMMGEDENIVVVDENESLKLTVKAIRMLATVSPHIRSTTTSATSDVMQLPALKIASFDGSIHTWATFRECFEQGVHCRTSMSGTHKLQYLKGLLTGEPEELVRNFSLSDENYLSAWKLLNDRYNNVRAQVFSQMRLITDQRKCSESADDLRRLLNRTTSAIMALTNLGRPTTHWDDWIVLHVMDKLDDESIRMWEQRLEDNVNMPEWSTCNGSLTDVSDHCQRHARKSMSQRALVSRNMFTHIMRMLTMTIVVHKMKMCIMQHR